MTDFIFKPALTFGLALAAAGAISCASTQTPAEDATAETLATTVAMPTIDCATATTPNLEALKVAAEGPHRPAANIARNAWRHPVETLAFFDVKPTSTVLEVWPGRGWYTEILAPYLKSCGQLRITNMDPKGGDSYGHKMAGDLQAMLDRAPEIYGDVTTAVVAPPAIGKFADDNSVDVVLTFRNNHNWMRDDIQAQIYASAFAALKPGGILGVVQHRGLEGTDPATAGDVGYVDTKVIVDAATAAGFVLDAESEINANPKDTKDHPKGVWTLPPALRLGDVDKAKYEAIGESDRMTLRFKKPAATDAADEAAAEGDDAEETAAEGE